MRHTSRSGRTKKRPFRLLTPCARAISSAAARDVAKVLKSATANAENNLKMSPEDLVVKTIFADEANPTWTTEKIDEVLASKKTVQADFLKPVPVYIVYFSAAASTDGKIVNYGDVYKRDAKVLAALDKQPVEGKDVATR